MVIKWEHNKQLYGGGEYWTVRGLDQKTADGKAPEITIGRYPQVRGGVWAGLQLMTADGHYYECGTVFPNMAAARAARPFRLESKNALLFAARVGVRVE